jgi:subtilisin family serine protease
MKRSAVSIASGITYVLAAGNDGQDVANVSPARVGEAITVAAMDALTDRRASFSNIGAGVDLFAPGVAIESAGIGSRTATAIFSGTSQAAPFVTGVVAAYLQTRPSATPAEVAQVLIGAAATDVIIDAGAGSPNRLLYTDSLGAQAAPF